MEGEPASRGDHRCFGWRRPARFRSFRGRTRSDADPVPAPRRDEPPSRGCVGGVVSLPGLGILMRMQGPGPGGTRDSDDRIGTLVELDGPNAGRRIQVAGNLTIGCGRSADTGASWEGGALIRKRGPERYDVREIDAHTPVYVNDERVVQTWLSNRDFLRVGETTYRFLLEPAAAPTSPSPPSRARHEQRCAACGKTFPRKLMVTRRGRSVCPRCARRTGARSNASSTTVAVVLTLLALLAAGLLVWITSGSDEKDLLGQIAIPPPLSTPALAEKNAPPPKTTAELVAQVEDAIALITNGECVGTGFLADERILVTNTHVVASMFLNEIRIHYPSRGGAKETPYAILHNDPFRDLCLLKVAPSSKPLPLARTVAFERGEDVILIGHPGLGNEIILENTVTRGLIGSVVTLEGHRYVQISASVNPGNSGGPVLNRDGEVVCVTTLKAVHAEGIALGIPINEVRTALRHARRIPDAEVAEITARHTASVVFLRLAGVGRAYLLAMFLNVRAMQFADAAGQDPSTALWRAKHDYEQVLKETTRRFSRNLELNYQQTVRRVDDPLATEIRSLDNCVKEIRAHVDDPHGLVHTYFTSYQRIRIRFASLISRLSHELGVGEDLESQLPDEE